jgi:uncharacterized membrane protein
MDFSFIVVFFLFLAIGGVLAVLSFAATRRIESTLQNFPLNLLAHRIYQLEQQVAKLEKLVSTPATRDTSPAAPAAPKPAHEVPHAPPLVPQPTAPAPASPTLHAPTPPPPPARRELPSLSAHTLTSPSREPSADDLEALIGGRWFNRIGIIALLIAVSYFLKLAFDNNWIGPTGRVSIGIFLGLLMLPWSEWLLRRDYTYFSEGIAGLGEATLFVSVWAGCQYYTLFTRQTGFAALVLVTIVMAFLALRRDSPRIAFLSLLGGLLTPALMSSGKNEQIVLFSYLLLLGAAALIVSWRRNWQPLLPLIFICTHLYFWQWYDVFYSRRLFLERTLLFATLFFALYAVIPALRAFRRANLTPMDHFLVAANAIAFSAAIFEMLWPADRSVLALIFILLAVFHAAVALVFTAPTASFSRGLYLAVAIAFLTLAIPTRFDGNTITLLLTIEGGILAWLGFRYPAGQLLRLAGYFLLAVSAFRLLLLPPPALTFLWNERFGSYLLLIAALIGPLWAAANSLPEVPETYPPTPRQTPANSDSVEAEITLLSIAVNFFALLALSLEIWDCLGRGTVSRDHLLSQHLSISVLWTAYAAVLLLSGLVRRSALLRWQALILLGIVVGKVFFLDLSSLDRAYRIASFFILGAVLLAVSFLYQRTARKRPAS